MLLFVYQGLSVLLTSTKGPIEVFLCPEENIGSPVKNGGPDVQGNSSPFLKVSAGTFPVGRVA
jgi:hypothetical protein